MLNDVTSMVVDPPMFMVVVKRGTPPVTVIALRLLLTADWPAVMVTPLSAVVPLNGTKFVNEVEGFLTILRLTQPLVLPVSFAETES